MAAVTSKFEELKTFINNIKNGHGKASDTNAIALDALVKRLEKTSAANLISFKDEILAAIATVTEPATKNRRATKKSNEKCSDGNSDSDQEKHDFRTSEVLAMKLAEVMVYVVYNIRVKLASLVIVSTLLNIISFNLRSRTRKKLMMRSDRQKNKELKRMRS